MAIRLRTVNGVRVALCAAETDELPGDVYLDDGEHYALAAKFQLDWRGELNDIEYPEEWAAMASQKIRDAVEECEKWCAERANRHCGAMDTGVLA
jgi:hypothetical protein